MHAERALADRPRDTGIVFPTLVPTLGTAYFMRGRFEEAADVLDGGLEAARLADIAQGRPGACSTARWRRSSPATSRRR